MAIFKGIAFPFKRDDQTLPATVEDDELVKQSITQIIMTGTGERVMRPDFGSNAYAYVFENNDTILAEMIRMNVYAAISKFEPRAVVQDVQVTRDETAVIVTVSFVVIATQNSLTVEAQLQSK
jgi:phage baseplate assembly protein W